MPRSRVSSTIGYSRRNAGAHGVAPLSPFDQILDLYVRGGDVYYRALKLERALSKPFDWTLNDLTGRGGR